VRTLCVLLVLQAVVSYRSIPRILDIVTCNTSLVINWIPHFTSVINWTLRLGLGLLKEVKPISEKWIAIIDHSIDIGTKKALVILRVTADKLQKRGSAITLEDCECIGLTVSDKITGESISEELTCIFKQSGHPCAIIKDKDSTLNKGVILWKKKEDAKTCIIDDIGHVVANALKKQFEKTKDYGEFKRLLSQGAARLRQTNLAFLIPPKLRSKGRFQSIGQLGKWGEKVLDKFAVKGRAKKNSLLDRFRTAFPGLSALRPFIETFAQAASITSQIMKQLKNKGFSQESHDHCKDLADSLPVRSTVKKEIKSWLDNHLTIYHKLNIPALLVSSDIIESLFGRFKHVIERSPQADMNRTVLLIPALCGNTDETTILRIFSQTCHAELKEWEMNNIPYTVRKNRQLFFSNDESKNWENLLLEK
jgi:hypothetical protein